MYIIIYRLGETRQHVSGASGPFDHYFWLI